MMFQSRRVLVSLTLTLSILLTGCAAKKPEPAAPTGGGAPAAAAPSTVNGARYAVESGQSKATYTVSEKFVNRDLPNDAVGTSSVISGELILAGGVLQPSTVSVDLRSLQSDSTRRDGVLRDRYLETGKYPLAVFAISGSGATLVEGKETPVQLNGKMTIHGVERPLVFTGTATLQGRELKLTAAAQFKLPDFGIAVPNIAGMLKADENVKVAVTLVAKKAQ